MRHRGEVFWSWEDPTLQHGSHEEELSDGAWLDVQVRLSRTRETQAFIGIYEPTGLARVEEAYDRRPGETMTKAMVWATRRGRSLAKEVCRDHHLKRPADEVSERWAMSSPLRLRLA
ncbi:hypothetical protein D3C76_336690 [compost metagenome]